MKIIFKGENKLSSMRVSRRELEYTYDLLEALLTVVGFKVSDTLDVTSDELDGDKRIIITKEK